MAGKYHATRTPNVYIPGWITVTVGCDLNRKSVQKRKHAISGGGTMPCGYRVFTMISKLCGKERHI